jgi:hypothetical protein
MLVVVTAAVLICTIAGAEFPELLSVHKASDNEPALTLCAAHQKPVPFRLDDCECAEQPRPVASLEGAGLASSDFPVLHFVLRI